MEKISVIIPAYRAEKYLAEAVESIRRQEWESVVEIVIVDDGSDDDTLSVAEKIGDIVLSQEKSSAASARNLGMRSASGNLILFLDADDMMTSGSLKHLYDPLRTSRENMAVFGMAEDFLSPDLTTEEKAILVTRKGAYRGVLPGCALIRREVFDRIGLFDESLKTGETVAWQMSLRDSGIPIVYIDFVTVKRRLHMANTGRVNTRQEMRDYAAILRRRMKGS